VERVSEERSEERSEESSEIASEIERVWDHPLDVSPGTAVRGQAMKH
jgi:hypothetical protein